MICLDECELFSQRRAAIKLDANLATAYNDLGGAYLEEQRVRLLALFEDAGLFVFVDSGGGETAAIHGDVDAGRQSLHKGEGAAEVEEAVGTAELVRDHGAGEDDGFPVTRSAT